MYIIIFHLILFCTNYSPCQHPPAWWYCLPTFKRKGLELEGRRGAVLQITVGHQQLPIVWKYWLAKKNLEITKMTEHISHIKKGILKLPNLNDLFFFPNFIIQLHLSLFQSSADTRIHQECVFTTFMYECWTRVWIAYSWKQFLFFLHKTLHDYSLWNIQINLTDGLRHT